MALLFVVGVWRFQWDPYPPRPLAPPLDEEFVLEAPCGAVSVLETVKLAEESLARPPRPCAEDDCRDDPPREGPRRPLLL